MLVKMSEFLRNLPPKNCTQCEDEMEEQHECYGNTCSKCLEIK
ncbi:MULTISPECIES: protein YhfH [Bacillus]|nr:MULTISPECIES: protein YhfH [Bacillus]